MPVQRDTTPAICSSVTASFTSLPSDDDASFRLDLGNHAVEQFRSAREVAATLRDLHFAARLVQLLLELLGLLHLLLLRLPRGGQGIRLILEFGKLLLQPRQSFARCGIILLAQRLALDLELDHPAVEFVEFLGLAVHLHAQPARGFVHQVDRLVGQEPVGDVAVRQRRRGDQRAIGDAHAVMQLVFLLDAAQDRDGVLDRRLAHEHRLEPPRQRRVLLDVLAVLVERGGADAVQRAARQLRLDQVRSIHRAFGAAGAHQVVQLVDEQDDLSLGRLDLLQHGLQPLLELAAIFRPGDHAPRSSASSCLPFSASGTSPLTMRSARPSTMAVLPTPGSPISTGLFLVRRASTWMVRRISSSRPITGSSFPSRASAVMSRAYFFSASKFELGVRAVDLAALADVVDRLLQRLGSRAGVAQRTGSRRVGGGDRHQQPVLRDDTRRRPWSRPAARHPGRARGQA